MPAPFLFALGAPTPQPIPQRAWLQLGARTVGASEFAARGWCMPTIRAWINPLACIPLELPPSPNTSPSPGASELLKYLFAPEAEGTVEAFVRRYREVASLPKAFPFAPAEPEILDKLVWPLRHAIGSYCLADYLGCVALCGMVGEMVAILLWEISPYPRGSPPLADKEQKQLFGRTFETLGQERRIDVLRGFRLIDDDTKAALSQLKAIRNRYLHFFSQPHDSLPGDARSAMDAARRVVTFTLKPTFQDGAVGLRPELMAYLDARPPEPTK